MNWLNSILILLAAFLSVFLQAVEGGVPHWLGTQVNLLPALVVYASLRGNLATVTLVALSGGLGFDSLSANPLGVSLLPLFVMGLLIHLKRDLILRDQFIAQFLLGLVSSAVVPALTLLLLFSVGQPPLLGWGSLWQWTILSLGGALLTPLCFRGFDLCSRALSYRPCLVSSFRTDREIRRNRY